MPKVIITCQQCEKEFSVIPSRKNAKFCSIKCRGLSKRIDRITKQCEICKKHFIKTQYDSNRGGEKYCSIQCASLSLSVKKRKGTLAENGHKICSKCEQLLLISSFSKQHKNKDGLHCYCKKCVSEGRNSKSCAIRKIITHYRVNQLEAEKLYKLQRESICLICGKLATDSLGRNPGILCIDHNHVTGKVRGVLCWNCNVLLGSSFDSPEILQQAINYLLESQRELEQ